MKTRATEVKDGHITGSIPKNRKQDRVSSPNYIAVFEILNQILERLSNSLPQIRQATRMLPDGATILNTGDELGQCIVGGDR